MPLDPDILRCAIVTAPFRAGKSIALAEYAKLMSEMTKVVVPDPRARGTTMGTMIVMDEFYRPPPYRVDFALVAQFKDHRFPGCTVTVREEDLERHDPRNRNPRAGRQKCWIVSGGGTEDKTLYNLNQAKFIAKTLHKRLVSAALSSRFPS
jgi:hypothetical protein